MPIVAMEPVRELFAAAVGVGVSLCIGPFAQCGLDEALSFAVSFGREGFGPDVPQAELATGLTECSGDIAATVIGHDPRNTDTKALIIEDCCLQEGDGAFLLLIRHDLDEGDARRIVNTNMY